MPIAGSPWDVDVLPGRADYPFSDASGSALAGAVAGVTQTFTIQARDAMGNDKITAAARDDAADEFAVTIAGPGLTSLSASLEYVGAGAYQATYTVLKAGYYELSVLTGGTHIYCGRGEADPCSPFALTVEPGAALASACEEESAPAPEADSLVEAAAGDVGAFAIMSKDTYGNNRWEGGDAFEVLMVLNDDADIAVRGSVEDFHNGSYLVTYTVPVKGFYEMKVTLDGENVRTCTSPVSSTVTRTGQALGFWYDRNFNGRDVYYAPSFCTQAALTLHVVHGPLHAPRARPRSTARSPRSARRP